jgi:hypothetical protein
MELSRPIPKATWLGDIAAHDPRLAYTLLKSGQVSGAGSRLGDGMTPGGYVDTGGWEIINLKATWNAPDPNQNIEAKLDGIAETDLWVRRVTYTVRRPDAFLNNIMKAQSDYYNSLNPNIDITQLTIKSYNRYVISPTNTPLENISTVFEAVAPAGLVLRTVATILATFTNLRAFTEIPPGSNLNAVISFHATRLPTGFYGSVDPAVALALLTEMGYFPGGAPNAPDAEGHE